MNSLVTKHFGRLLEAKFIAQGNTVGKNLRTNGAPVLVELGRCLDDAAVVCLHGTMTGMANGVLAR